VSTERDLLLARIAETLDAINRNLETIGNLIERYVYPPAITQADHLSPVRDRKDAQQWADTLHRAAVRETTVWGRDGITPEDAAGIEPPLTSKAVDRVIRGVGWTP